jgi:hypothetical protein
MFQFVILQIAQGDARNEDILERWADTAVRSLVVVSVLRMMVRRHVTGCPVPYVTRQPDGRLFQTVH